MSYLIDFLIAAWVAHLVVGGVFFFLIILFSIYLVITSNPGRSKVAMAAREAIARQMGQGVQSITVDSREIAKAVGIKDITVARRMLVHCQAKGEISNRVSIL